MGSIEGGAGPIRFENPMAIERQIQNDQGYDKVYVKETTVSGQKQWKIAVKTGGRIEAFKQASREALSGKKEPVKYDSLSNKLAQYFQGVSSDLFNQEAFKGLATKALLNTDIVPQAVAAGVKDGGTRLMAHYKNIEKFEDRQKLYHEFPKKLKNKALEFERNEVAKMRQRVNDTKEHLKSYDSYWGRAGSLHATAAQQKQNTALEAECEKREEAIREMSRA
jgi:hypothetical protein